MFLGGGPSKSGVAAKHPFERRRLPAVAVALFVAAVIGIVVGGSFFYRARKEQLLQERRDEVRVVAILKAREINSWRAERLGDAGIVAQSPLVQPGIALWLARPDPAFSRTLRLHFLLLQQEYHYRDIVAVDREGHVRLSLEGKEKVLDDQTMLNLKGALRSRFPVLCDLHTVPGESAPRMEAIAPVGNVVGGRWHAVGAVILVIDTRQFLFPLLRGWPLPRFSAETLLLRREGRKFLVLNGLRHPTRTGLAPKMWGNLLSGPPHLALQEAGEGKDYRGVDVVYAAAWVHDSPWLVVAQMDSDEALRAARLQGRLVVGIVIAFVVAATAGVALFHQRLQRDHFRFLNTELEKQVQERTAKLHAALESLRMEMDKRMLAAKELRERDQLLIQQSRLAAMGEMINNIAHQWRQPLNVLGLIIQEMPMMYEIGKFSEEYLNEQVDKASKLISHMSETINIFRNFFQPSSKKSVFTVQNLVAKTLALVSESLKSAEITLEVDLVGEPTMYGYLSECCQVLLNLLLNARDAFMEGGREKPWVIKMTAVAENGRTVLTVADNAGGIAETVIGKIFDPYFTTKGPSKGTGIGLFMAKNIIEKHMSGTLLVRNAQDGAEFTITTPNHPPVS